MNHWVFSLPVAFALLLGSNSFLFAQEEAAKKDAGDPEGDTFLYRLSQFLVPDKDAKPTRPNIKDPGPDTADFPNSPSTLPKGRAYIETSPFTLTGGSGFQPTVYNWEYLFRYGVTDKVEFRLFGNGLTAIYLDKHIDRETSGFAPVVFDFKVNFWDEPDENKWMPAMGLEVFLQTNFCSPAFKDGLQPGITLLFDKELTDTWSLEWNIGVQGEGIGKREKKLALELAIQWALEKQVTDDFAIYTHGYYNGASLPRFSNDIVVGGGMKYDLSERLTVFGTYNVGVVKNQSPYNTYFGLARAF